MARPIRKPIKPKKPQPPQKPKAEAESLSDDSTINYAVFESSSVELGSEDVIEEDE